MGETGSDDGDIVLEEVSQIYRCKDCLRCFISFSKFAEHFPVYHPDKVQITAGNQQSAKENLSQKSSINPGAASEVPENIPQHGTDDGNQTIVEKSTNDDTVIPTRKKKFLKRNGLHVNTSDSSDSQSMSSGDDHRESALPGKDAACVATATCVDPAEEVIHHDEPQSNMDTHNDHEIVEENVRKKQKKSIQIRENSHDHDEPCENISPEALNDTSILIVNKVAKNDKPHEPMEVITLSDSDDDSFSCGTPAFTNTINLSSSRIKIEVVNESDPSEKDIAHLQQPNNAPVTEGAKSSDNEKILEDKDTLSSPAPQKKLLCEFCTKPFTRERTLQSHMKSIHRSELEAHEKLQKKKDSHLMENCSGKDGSELVKTNKRKRKTKVDKAKTSDKNVINVSLGFTCKWCPRKFKLLEDLKSHAYNEHIKYKSVV